MRQFMFLRHFIPVAFSNHKYNKITRLAQTQKLCLANIQSASCFGQYECRHAVTRLK